MDGIFSIGGLLDASFPRTRESRFGLRPISLDTRFRGYDGIQVDLFIVKTIPFHVFSKEDTKSTKFGILI
ncbi:MAG: hypothetical protein ACXW6R_24810, partial [Candidatus Binatia bacterium]